VQLSFHIGRALSEMRGRGAVTPPPFPFYLCWFEDAAVAYTPERSCLFKGGVAFTCILVALELDCFSALIILWGRVGMYGDGLSLAVSDCCEGTAKSLVSMRSSDGWEGFGCDEEKLRV